MAQRTQTETSLSADERMRARMAAQLAGQDPDQLTDTELREHLSDGASGSQSPADADQPTGSAEEQTAEESAQEQPSDDSESPAEQEQQPRPQGNPDNPLDSVIRDIAREEDDWRRDNEIQPELTRLNAKVSSLAEAQQRMAERAPQVTRSEVTVKSPDRPDVTVKGQHPAFEVLLRAISVNVNVCLVGAAGSGKTTLAQTVAATLGRPFYMTGAVLQSYQLMGFIDAGGTYQRTQFRDAFEHGGVFLFDEQDASAAAALLSFNAALAGEFGDFPDGLVKRHPDFVCIAAANTYGRGADRQYVGRNQLDAASLDRYAVLDLDYDESLEANWARAALGLPAESTSTAKPPRFPKCKDRTMSGEDVDAWAAKVQGYRAAAELNKVRHVISPRASINGAKLLSAGVPESLVETMVIWKGLDAATIKKIKAAA